MWGQGVALPRTHLALRVRTTEGVRVRVAHTRVQDAHTHLATACAGKGARDGRAERIKDTADSHATARRQAAYGDHLRSRGSNDNVLDACTRVGMEKGGWGAGVSVSVRGSVAV